MARCRHADVLQHLIVDLLEQAHIDLVGLERVDISRETDPLQPSSNFVHAASFSSSVLAFWRTGVSKPSVNHP